MKPIIEIKNLNAVVYDGIEVFDFNNRFHCFILGSSLGSALGLYSAFPFPNRKIRD